MNEHAERAIIVTGAASGIGLAMALGLLRTGTRVTMMDRSETTLRSALQQAREIAGDDHILEYVGDITSEDDARQVVAQTQSHFGSLGALVNNAGIGRGTIRPDFLRNPIKFWDMTATQWRRTVASAPSSWHAHRDRSPARQTSHEGPRSAPAPKSHT